MNTTFQHEHYSESLKAACWLPLCFQMFQFSNLQTFKLSNSQTMGENHIREHFLRTFSLVPKRRWCALQCVSECRAKCKKTVAAKSKAKQRRYVRLGGQFPRPIYAQTRTQHVTSKTRSRWVKSTTPLKISCFTHGREHDDHAQTLRCQSRNHC